MPAAASSRCRLDAAAPGVRGAGNGVAKGHGGQQVGRRRDDRFQQLAFGSGGRRGVEQQDGAGRQHGRFGAQPPCGGGDRLGSADRTGAIGFDGGAGEQRRQVAAHRRHAPQRRGVHAGQLQLAQRAGDGARKAGEIGDRREVRQLARLVRVEGDASGNRFGAERATWRDQPFGQRRQRQPHRQLGEGHSRHADQRAAVAGDSERQLVGRGSGRADDEDAVAGVRLDERAGCRQAHRGRRIDDDGITQRHDGPVVEDTRRISAGLGARDSGLGMGAPRDESAADG